MGWAVQGSSPDGSEFFRTRSDRPGAHPASYTMDTEPFPEVKRAGAWYLPPTLSNA
jgi:hypothetical protein